MDTNSKNKKVIVTGASGQTASYMIDFLMEKTDHIVVAAIRRTSQIIDSHFKKYYGHSRFKIIHFDLLDCHSITNTIKNEKPDYFINFAAQSFVADSWHMPALHFQTNALGVLHILEAIKNHVPTCRFYNAGSSEEFGDVLYSPQDINHPLRPRSPYGASKAAARQLVKVWRESYGIYAVQGVLFNHESSRRQKYFVTRKITSNVARIHNSIKNGESNFEPLELGNIDSKRDWSDAADVVTGVWAMMNQEKPKDYVLSSNETHSVREFVELAFQAAGIQGRWQGEGVNEVFLHEGTDQVLMKVNPEFYRLAEVDVLWGLSDPARQELGWKPKTSFSQLVEKMVASDLGLPYDK